VAGDRPSELVALGKALEELERPKARERQETANPDGRQTSAVRANSSPPKRDDAGYTRTIVGEALGVMKRTHYPLQAPGTRRMQAFSSAANQMPTPRVAS
jgi:hypothetical protein